MLCLKLIAFNVLPLAQTGLEVPVPAGHRALVYLIAGTLRVANRLITPRQMAVLSPGDLIPLQADAEGVRALVLAARPLGEPVAHYDPFVMNTRAEIQQAINDYEMGRLTA